MTDQVLPELPSSGTFASELIKARTELGLTQTKLAELASLSVSAIKAYETGRNLPGARELRELCQALQISPNKLLFGTEVPFKDRGFANLLVDAVDEEDHVIQARVASLMRLLSKEEQRAVGTLVSSLAVARHGADKAKENTKAADLFVGLARDLFLQTRDALNAGKPLDTKGLEQRVDAFMERMGHNSNPEKLPEK